MALDVRAHLSTPAGRRVMGDEVAKLMRQREFSVAEGLLVAYLTQYPGQIATACRGVPDGGIEVHGWDSVAAGLSEAAELGVHITGVGLDLSNFSDATGAEWWDKEPVVEVTWYDDEPFAFSLASRRHLVAAVEMHPLPWTGAGASGEPSELSVSGLRSLNGALLQGEAERPWSFGADDPGADDAVATMLGGWFLHLRFHQAVARLLAGDPQGLGVPVVVGQHGIGPYFVSAYLPRDDLEPVGAGPATERTGTRALLERARRFRRRGQELGRALEREVS